VAYADPERRAGARSSELQHDRLLRHLFGDNAPPGSTGECMPPMDVLETTDAIELVMDLPGVAATDLRIVFSHGTLIVTGQKTPGRCGDRKAAFHLAERSFGRFTRAVRLAGAFDAGQARATLAEGELRIVLPRIEERRGRDIQIAVSQG
jgi:HSP20 family protein